MGFYGRNQQSPLGFCSGANFPFPGYSIFDRPSNTPSFSINAYVVVSVELRCGNAETIVGGKDSDPSLWGAPFFGTQKKVMGIEWHQHLPGLVMTNSFAIENGDL